MPPLSPLERLSRLARRLLLPFPKPFARIGVAVSGGADSVALLRLLLALPDAERPELVVLHVDHAARPESAQDARWVEDLAGRLGCAFRSVRLDPPSCTVMAKDGGFEAWARDCRHEAFSTFRRRENLDAIALGHHAGDQAETLLLRLVRGASLPGLGGMRKWRTIRVDRRTLPLWRPLLETEPAFLRETLRDIGQDWREDTTNTDPRFLRNRVRAELMPFFEALRAGAVRRLAGTASELAAAQHDLERRGRKLFRFYNPEPRSLGWHGTPSGDGPPARAHLTLPPKYGKNLLPWRIPLLREIIRQWLCVVSPMMAERLDRGLMELLVDLVRSGARNRTVEFCHNRIMRTTKGLKLVEGKIPKAKGERS